MLGLLTPFLKYSPKTVRFPSNLSRTASSPQSKTSTLTSSSPPPSCTYAFFTLDERGRRLVSGRIQTSSSLSSDPGRVGKLEQMRVEREKGLGAAAWPLASARVQMAWWMSVYVLCMMDV
eukprot:1361221-Amorphochlora_amoeboformis.AAC.1